MFKLVPLIFRNVLRSRRRSLLTLASTAISLGLLALMLAIYQGFFHAEDSSPSEALRLVCRHRVSLTQTLPASYQQRILAIEGVADATAWSWFQGTYIEPQNFFARFAVDPDRVFNIRQDWIISDEQRTAFQRERTACAIGEAIAEKYDIELGDRMTIVGDIYDVTLELTVAAIFRHPPNTESLVFHREYLTELLPQAAASRDEVGTYLILADSPAAVPRVARAIDTMFDNSPYPTRTESEKEFGRSFLAFLGNIKLFLAAICGALTFTILLVSANTVAMAVRERTREMAVLRTLGYTPGEILLLVLGEAMLISIVGGALGVALGAGLAALIASGSGGFPLPGVKWQAATVVITLAAIIGVLAALVPAVLASRKNIVESLRFSG
ncbi:MAG TPA: FtsX-like permease family protein [Tepidisphaeraceae bacterium]|jgi:putative ABC transport system permease protein|nr:FtsX-like permease family protein [Tepidisphaeraceae bacterium]